MIQLTIEERRKFAQYLEEHALSDKAMIEQQEKMNLPSSLKESLMKRLKNEYTAKMIVANILNTTETQET